MTERAATFLWAGRPVYRCQFEPCQFERVENLRAVLEHEAAAHAEVVRQSPILGLDEKPLLVAEGPKASESTNQTKQQSRRRRK